MFKGCGMTLLLCVAVLSLPVSGQGRCSLETIVGTYAFQSVGASTIVNGNSPVPGDPVHWSALHAPMAFTGIANIKRDGTTQGFYWSVNGRMNMGLTPIPVTGRVGDLDADSCIVIIEYAVPVSATRTATVKEVFFILDQGKELHSVAWETPLETAAWTTTMKRISQKALDSDVCKQEHLRGRYLLKCGGIQTMDGSYPFLGYASMIDVNVGRDGNFTGTLFGKMGVLSILPAEGNYKVNSDCSVEGTLGSPMIRGLLNVGRGVLYDEGKAGFYQPLVNRLPPPFPDIPQPFGVCEIIRVER